VSSEGAHRTQLQAVSSEGAHRTRLPAVISEGLHRMHRRDQVNAGYRLSGREQCKEERAAVLQRPAQTGPPAEATAVGAEGSAAAVLTGIESGCPARAH